MARLYVVLGCVMLCVVVTIWGRARTRRLAASRVGENFDTFCSGFEPGAVPLQDLRAVYASFRDVHTGVVQHFPVRATDDIGRVYGVADEDLDDMILDALAACGKQLPPQAMLDKLVPVLTVRDFALFVAACPPAENANPC